MAVVLIGVALNGFVITIDQGMPVKIPPDWQTSSHVGATREAPPTRSGRPPARAHRHHRAAQARRDHLVRRPHHRVRTRRRDATGRAGAPAARDRRSPNATPTPRPSCASTRAAGAPGVDASAAAPARSHTTAAGPSARARGPRRRGSRRTATGNGTRHALRRGRIDRPRSRMRSSASSAREVVHVAGARIERLERGGRRDRRRRRSGRRTRSRPSTPDSRSRPARPCVGLTSRAPSRRSPATISAADCNGSIPRSNAAVTSATSLASAWVPGCGSSSVTWPMWCSNAAVSSVCRCESSRSSSRPMRGRELARPVRRGRRAPARRARAPSRAPRSSGGRCG